MQQIEPVRDEIFERYQYDERSELVEKAVISKVHRMKDEQQSSSGNGG